MSTNKKNNKLEELWILFMGLGTMFFMISTTIDITWLKLTLLGIAIIEYIVAIIFAAKNYSNKKQNIQTNTHEFPPPPPPSIPSSNRGTEL